MQTATLGIERKGVLPIGVKSLLAENRVGVGLTRSTVRQLNNARMVVRSLWRESGNIHIFILDGKSYRQG